MQFYCKLILTVEDVLYTDNRCKSFFLFIYSYSFLRMRNNSSSFLTHLFDIIRFITALLIFDTKKNFYNVQTVFMKRTQIRRYITNLDYDCFVQTIMKAINKMIICFQRPGWITFVKIRNKKILQNNNSTLLNSYSCNLRFNTLARDGIRTKQ